MNLAIINARMRSSRFPGKLMQELVDGKSVLEVFLERMKEVKSWDGMVLAIQKEPENLPLKALADKMGIPTWESSLPPLANGAGDVLGRTKEVADHYKANTIIRVTPDNPTLHRDLISRACINYYMNRNACHYVSNCWHRGDNGNGFPRGAEVEVFSYALLGQMDNETNRPGDRNPPLQVDEPEWKLRQMEYDREHVTTWARRFPRLIGHADIVPQTGMQGNTALGLVKFQESIPVRLTLDYPEDLEVLRNVFGELYGKPPIIPDHGVFSLTDIANLYYGNPQKNIPGKPELFKANQHIQQWG